MAKFANQSYQDASKYFEKVHSLSIGHGFIEPYLKSQIMLANIATKTRDFKTARILLEDIFNIVVQLDDYEIAAIYFERLAQFFERLGDTITTHDGFYYYFQDMLDPELALVEQPDQKFYHQAWDYFVISRWCYEEKGDRLEIASINTNIADVLLQIGLPIAAKGIYREALTTFKEMNAKPNATVALNHLAALETADDNFEKAEPLLEEALEYAKEGKAAHHEMESYYGLALLEKRKGEDLNAAQAYLETAEEIGIKNGLFHELPRVISLSAEIKTMKKGTGDGS